MKSFYRLLSAAAFTLTALSVQAEPADLKTNSVPGNEPAAVEFRSLDTNGDGRISRKEFVSARPERKRWWRQDPGAEGQATERDMARPEVFQAMDVNRDGFLSESELANAQITQNVRGRLNRDGAEGNNSLNQHPEPHTKPGSNTIDPSAEHQEKREK